MPILISVNAERKIDSISAGPGLVLETGSGRGLSILCVLCIAKQWCDGSYRQKKAVRPVGQRNEIKVPVKTRGLRIDGIDDYGNSGDLHADWLETDGGYLPDCFL